jgi:hypothetical protein
MGLLEGGCLCGAIRYRAEGNAFGSVACHCRDCQRIAAGSAANFLMIRKAEVSVTGQAQAWTKQGDSGRSITRSFCGTCGTPLFIALEMLPDAVGLAVGSLDDPSAYKPGMEIWLDSAPPWHRPAPDVPQFKKGPGPAG